MTQERCGDCKHLKERVQANHVCKLNCVGRRYGDTCLWDTKRYPSRFEPKGVVTCCWCGKNAAIALAGGMFMHVFVYDHDRVICNDCYERLKLFGDITLSEQTMP